MIPGFYFLIMYVLEIVVQYHMSFRIIVSEPLENTGHYHIGGVY